MHELVHRTPRHFGIGTPTPRLPRWSRRLRCTAPWSASFGRQTFGLARRGAVKRAPMVQSGSSVGGYGYPMASRPYEIRWRRCRSSSPQPDLPDLSAQSDDVGVPPDDLERGGLVQMPRDRGEPSVSVDLEEPARVRVRRRTLGSCPGVKWPWDKPLRGVPPRTPRPRGVDRRRPLR